MHSNYKRKTSLSKIIQFVHGIYEENYFINKLTNSFPESFYNEEKYQDQSFIGAIKW